MNNNKLNILRGARMTDGIHVLRFWGKFLSNTNTRYMIYVFFDENDECHELRVQQVLKLNKV